MTTDAPGTDVSGERLRSVRPLWVAIMECGAFKGCRNDDRAQRVRSTRKRGKSRHGPGNVL